MKAQAEPRVWRAEDGTLLLGGEVHIDLPETLALATAPAIMVRVAVAIDEDTPSGELPDRLIRAARSILQQAMSGIEEN